MKAIKGLGANASDVRNDDQKAPEIPPAKPWQVKPCAFCGEPCPDPAIDRFGKPSKKFGKYCSAWCADEVDGFDNRVHRDQRYDTRPYNAAKHETRLVWKIRQPDELAAEREEAKKDPSNAERSALFEGVMRTAYELDPRLPSILHGMMKGESQATIAKGLRMTQQNVAKLYKKLRASVQPLKASKESERRKW